MKRVFFIAMKVSLTLLLFSTSGLTQQQGLQPVAPGQVRVPEVIGEELSQARTIMENAGLKVARVIERETKLADGLVANQRPEAGAVAAKGSGVILVVSKKGATSANEPQVSTELPTKQVQLATPPKTTPVKKTSALIPVVTGKNMREAFQEIRRAGFSNIQPQRMNSAEPRETVVAVLVDNAAVDFNREYNLDAALILQISTGIAAKPTKDAIIQTPTRDQQVKLPTPEVVAKPPSKEKPAIMPQGAIRVPDDIIGKSALALASNLHKHDIAYVIQKVKSEQKVGLIVALSMNGKPLSSGDIVQPGDKVTIDASAGPQYNAAAGPAQVKLPDIEKMELPDAIAKLRNKGLPATLEEVASDQPAGTVVGAESQGRPLKPGDTVSASVDPIKISVSGGKNPQTLPTGSAAGNKPEILDFTADKTQLTSLVNPENVTLKWTTKNAAKVVVQKRFKNANGQWQKEQVHTQTLVQPGSMTTAVQPGQVVCQVQGAAVFTLFAANKAGPASRSISVTAEARPQILYFGTGDGLPTPAVQPQLQEQTQKERMIRTRKGPAAWEESFYEPAAPPEYQATLVWQIAGLGANGTAVLQPGIGTVTANSSCTVSVSSPTTYTLIARNSAGMDSAVCVVGIPKPTIPSFGSRPSVLEHVGDTVTLVWQTTNAERVTLTPPGATVGADGEYSSGWMEPTVFKLRAENSGGAVEKEVKVNIKDYVSGLYLFEVIPDHIDPYAGAKLHIIALNLLDSGGITVTSDPVIPGLAEWSNAMAGHRNVDETFYFFWIPYTTKFTARVATLDGKRSTKSATVTVGKTPQVAFFGTEDCHSVSGRMQCQLRWDVRDANSVTIEPGIGAVQASGHSFIDMSVPKLYILTAVGDPANNVVLDSVWSGDPAQLQAKPQIHQFTATPAIVTPANRSVKLTWSGTGVKAAVRKLRDGHAVKRWDDLQVVDSITDEIQNNVTFELTLISLASTTSKSVQVEYQKPPTLTVSGQPTRVIIGEAATLSWQTQDLGSNGQVLLQNTTTLAASGNKTVRPEKTTTYEFLARNTAGEVKRQVTIETLEPEFEITYLSWPPSRLIREKQYLIDLQVQRVDSLLFWETYETGTKVLVHTTVPAHHNEVTKVSWQYKPMVGRAMSAKKPVTLSMQMIQKGYPTKTHNTTHEVWPSVDLVAKPSFTYGHDTYGYLIHITLEVQNNGKDMFITSNTTTGKYTNVAVVFPPLINTYYFDPSPPVYDTNLTGLYTMLRPDDGALGQYADKYDYAVTTATVMADAVLGELPYSNVLVFDLRSPDLPHIGPNGSRVLKGDLRLPALRPGTYQIETLTDADNFLDELVESNNVQVTLVGATDTVDLTSTGSMSELANLLCGFTIRADAGNGPGTGDFGTAENNDGDCVFTQYDLHFE